LTIRKLFTIILGTFFVLLILIGCLSITLLLNQADLNEQQQIRFRSYLLTDELHQISDDLTNFARAYVTIGDSKYEQYYREALAIHNGEKPRPDNYRRADRYYHSAEGKKLHADEKSTPLHRLMTMSGLDREELNKLAEAQNNFDVLVSREITAINARKGLFADGTGRFTLRGKPDQALAFRLMHDDNYQYIKAKTMQPIDDFTALLEQRTALAVKKLVRRDNFLFASVIALSFLLIIMTALSFVFILRRISLPLSLLKKQTAGMEADLVRLAHIARGIAKGELLASYSVSTAPLWLRDSDEIALLARSHDNMINHLQKTGESIAAITAELSETTYQVKKEKQFLQMVIDASPGFVYVKDLKWEILLANKSMADAFNTTPDQMIGKTTLDFLPNREEVEKRHNEYLKVIQSRKPKHIPDEMITYPDGSIHRHMIFLIPLLDKNNGDSRILGTTTDITALKIAEQEKAKLFADLQKINAELNDFAYVVSHDLKAPLRAIGSLSDWIYQDNIDKVDDTSRQNLTILKSRVQRMQSLIEGVLTYSRTARTHEDMKTINLKKALEEAVDLLTPPPSIRLEYPEAMPDVTYETTKLVQVLQNLVGNAIKYMDKQEGLIKINCREKDGNWVISIEDNGPGIDAKHFDKIFQIFQTLNPRDEIESTGIGLTIVKKIVEMNGGRIWVESQVGEGTTFFFTIKQ
jgi:PAS domain S-box-containing protein